MIKVKFISELPLLQITAQIGYQVYRTDYVREVKLELGIIGYPRALQLTVETNVISRNFQITETNRKKEVTSL